MPVLDDDGFVLWESHAIMQYLADKTPGQTLYPTGLRERSDVNRWLWCAAHLMREHGGVLDAHLATREWISGDALTLADYAIAAPLADSARAKLPVEGLNHIQRWFAGVRAQEAWKATEQ